MGRAMGALEYFSDLIEVVRRSKKRKQLQTVEMKVKINCDGCEHQIRRALSSMSGVQSVDINRKMHKVTVSGYVEPKKKVLEKVKGGKRAEPWPYVRYSAVTQPFSAQMYNKRAPSGFVRKEKLNTIPSSDRQDDFFRLILHWDDFSDI